MSTDRPPSASRLPPPIALSPSADAFTCRICVELASRPVVSVCSQQCAYCLHCFERYLEMRPASARDRCCVICLDVPVSRGRLYEDVLAANPLLSRIYRSIEVACPKEGCDWKGPLDQYRRHGASCSRQTVLESLGEKLDRTLAELEQTRAERDNARTERDQARVERDGLAGMGAADATNGSASNVLAVGANGNGNTTATAMENFNSIFARRSWGNVGRETARRTIQDFVRWYNRPISDDLIEKLLSLEKPKATLDSSRSLLGNMALSSPTPASTVSIGE